MSDVAELGGPPSEIRHVLVTGATGKQGGALARLLLRRGHRVRALTRNPESPAAVRLRTTGAEIVSGDLGDRAAVERAAAGVDVAFVVATPYEQGTEAEIRFATTALDAARAAGVPYLVYSSVGDANRQTGIPHFDSKFTVEEHLKGLGAEYCIVAPVFFRENLLAPRSAAALAQGTLALGVAADRKLQTISVAEIAEFTALVVENPRSFRGARIDLASDELTPVEMARGVSDASGRKVAYVPIPLEVLRKQSEDLAKMNDWFNRVGYSVDIPKLRREHPKVRWRSFREWAGSQDWARLLAPPA